MPIGLIAGRGRLPEIFKESARRSGEEVFSVGVKGITDSQVDELLPVGKVGGLIKLFKKKGSS